VYNTERQMVTNFKKDLPAIGTDIKVMGMRKNHSITLTVACAMIGKHVNDQDHYFQIKDELKGKILDLSGKYTDREVEIFVNTGTMKSLVLFISRSQALQPRWATMALWDAGTGAMV